MLEFGFVESQRLNYYHFSKNEVISLIIFQTFKSTYFNLASYHTV
jgi:hypothetical protein